MINPLDLSGRRLLVTGASSGIGRETAALLAGLGASVILTGRDEERLRQTALTAGVERCRIEPYDLTRLDEIPVWIKALSDEVPLDGIAHCAGDQWIRPLQFLSAADIRACLALDLETALHLAKGLRQRGVTPGAASLVFVSSVAGIVGEAANSAYCAAKGGLIALARALAIELAPQRIRVNAVAPGLVRTELLARMQRVYSPEQLRQIEERHPLGVGEPRDVAHAIAFLLSDAARWVTGTTLVVDGGYTSQ